MNKENTRHGQEVKQLEKLKESEQTINKTAMKKARGDLVDAKKKNKKIRNSVQKINERISEFKYEIKLASEQIEKNKAEIITLKKSLKSIDSEIEGYNTRMSDLKKQIEAQRKIKDIEIAKLRQKFATQKQEQKAEFDQDAEEKYAAYEKKDQEEFRQSEWAKKEAELNTKHVEEMTTLNEDFEKKIENIEKDIKTRSETIEQELETKKIEIKRSYKAAVESSRAMHKDRRAKIAEHLDQKQALEQELQKLSRLYDSSKKQLLKTRRDINLQKIEEWYLGEQQNIQTKHMANAFNMESELKDCAEIYENRKRKIEENEPLDDAFFEEEEQMKEIRDSLGQLKEPEELETPSPNSSSNDSYSSSDDLDDSI